MEKLKISRISGLMFVDIDLWSIKENKYRTMSILVDTGASVTTISDYILTSIGYTAASKPVTVTTASGTARVHSKTITKVRIGSVEIENVDVYAHNFPDECFSDGVIGMNVLEKFNFSVNLDDGVIELKQRTAL
jgi:clan AA aspartic protease (TIGR02281 family)